jgi:hypothetical protein
VPAGADAGAFANAKVAHKNVADRTIRLAILNMASPKKICMTEPLSGAGHFRWLSSNQLKST